MTLLAEAKELKEEVVCNRRHLHQNAEVGFELAETRAYVSEKLREMGYEPKEVGGGIVAIAGGKKPGKVFLLRADMDALPIQEQTDLDFKSQTANMHACGHDCHTSMLLGAARLLKNHEDEIEGQIKLMFQPGEEILLGAKKMIDEGLMENPKVDAAMAIHVMTGQPLPVGKLILPQAGVLTSAADWFEIHVQGKGCHGAMPNTGVDPLNAAAKIFEGLQSIHAREMPTGSSLALTVGQLHGGSVSNVVPDTAYMTGTIRTLDADVRALAKERMIQISEGTAKTYRADAEVKFSTECPSVMLDADMVAQGNQYVTELLGANGVDDKEENKYLFRNGSEDFSLVADMVPSTFFALTAGDSREGYGYPLHHPKAKMNEDALPIGVAAYAHVAIEWLKNNK